MPKEFPLAAQRQINALERKNIKLEQRILRLQQQLADAKHEKQIAELKSKKANVANVPMPTDQERAERRAMHDKLDAIAKRLRD